jgi:dolichol-phosphate mannosyltransferase
MMEERSPDYSIVVPVYFNEGALTDLLATIKADVMAKTAGRSCEVIFVDDGSRDGSLDELRRLQRVNPALVTVVKLTRNFGQVSALLAGFGLARGRCVVAMSADGQDPATLIPQMLEAHFVERYQIVVGARKGRDESRFRIWTSRLFYVLMRKLSFPEMPPGGFDYVLLGRPVLDVLLRNREVNPFLQGQILWTGFKIKFLEYQRAERKIGTSRWTLAKKLSYLVDGVIGYSFFPIRILSLMGILVALLGFAYAILIAILKVMWKIPVQGWAPLMIVILVMSGVQIVMLGVIGEYVWRTLAQARNRDPYIIEAIYGDRDPDDGAS